MKIKKLISILLTLDFVNLEGVLHDGERLSEAVERYYKRIEDLKKEAAEMGLTYEPQNVPIPESFHDFLFSVKDENGLGTTARVKLFPVSDLDNRPFSKMRDERLVMVLKNTNPSGLLTVQVPCFMLAGFQEGNIKAEAIKGYFVEVSKGSEYAIESRYIPLERSNEEHVFEFELKRIASIQKSGWFAGDLHHHSIYSSPVFGGDDDVIESVEEVRNSMAAAGLSFGALSDHHNILNHESWQQTKTDWFLPIPSKEISTSNGHVMSLNVSHDVIYNIPTQEERTLKYLREEFYRITTDIKTSGGLAQINHPRDKQAAIALSEDMRKHIQVFDTMEVWNGSVPLVENTTNNQAFRLWLDLLKSDMYVPATTGSDTHNTRADDYHHMVDELIWLMACMEQLAPSDETGKMIHEVFKQTIGSLIRWAQQNLGSGGVRTYIFQPSGNCSDVKEVLKALRHGSSFLTNGPILIASVKGVTMGNTIWYGEGLNGMPLRLICTIAANRPVTQLTLMTKKGLVYQQDLNVGVEDGEVTVEIELEPTWFEKKDWLICKIESDFTNMAFTNPIFINK